MKHLLIAALLLLLTLRLALAQDALVCDLALNAPAMDDPACERAWLDANLRLNHLQLLGSHNSYHIAPDAGLQQAWEETGRNRDGLAAIDYTHLPLADQLTLGLRHLELDPYHDPEGGLFANPVGLEIIETAGFPAGPPFDPDGLLALPGVKVLHIHDVDYRTHCYTLVECLSQVRAWSQRNPGHLPIMIFLNPKDSYVGRNDPNVERRARYAQPLEWDRAALLALEAEIRSVFTPEQLVTPAAVRGDYATLNEAITTEGWPTLEALRGRVLFTLFNRDLTRAYLEGDPTYSERLLFVNAIDGFPWAAYVVVDNPRSDGQRITDLVQQGYMVRTRTDANTREARAGDYRRAQAAYRSGAQWLSTDYYVPDPAIDPRFRIRLPGDLTVRCNPVTAPARCDERYLED